MEGGGLEWWWTARTSWYVDESRRFSSNQNDLVFSVHCSHYTPHSTRPLRIHSRTLVLNRLSHHLPRQYVLHFTQLEDLSLSPKYTSVFLSIERTIHKYLFLHRNTIIFSFPYLFAYISSSLTPCSIINDPYTHTKSASSLSKNKVKKLTATKASHPHEQKQST